MPIRRLLGACICVSGWSGALCLNATCPNKCSAPIGQGRCSTDGSHCICLPGFTGLACDQPTVANTWALIATDGVPFSPSMGHSTVYSASTDSMYVFGGYSLYAMFNDVYQFSFQTATWTKIQPLSDIRPAPRYLHTSVLYNNVIYVFGGSTAPSVYNNELWAFGLDTKLWTHFNASGTAPDARIGHVSVLVGHIMYVYGGLTLNKVFDVALYALNLDTMTWTTVVTSGALPPGRYQPSLTYDSIRNQLILFGGATTVFFSPGPSFYVQRSDSLFYLNLATFSWSEVPFTTTDCSDAACQTVQRCNTFCKGRIGHAAVVKNDLLVVFGGSNFIHTYNDACQSSEILVFNVSCAIWINNGNISGAQPVPRQAHSMIMRSDNSLVVVGGYGGVVFNDIWTVSLPSTFCAYHGTLLACTNDRVCAWNSVTGVCVDAPATSLSNTSLISSSIQCGLPACVYRTLSVSSSTDLCFACIGPGNCVYCASTSQCVAAASMCPSQSAAIYSATIPCPTCTSFSNCFECTNANCAWSPYTRTCAVSFSNSLSPITSPAQCGILCSVFTDCQSCQNSATGCSWCSATSTCYPDSAMTTEFGLGQCLSYAPYYCGGLDCGQRRSSASCLSNTYCGWCGDVNGVGNGTCYDGTLAGPGLPGPLVNAACPVTLNASSHLLAPPTATSNASWSYYESPNINQCLSPKLNSCGSNALCIDIPDYSLSTGPTVGYMCV